MFLVTLAWFFGAFWMSATAGAAPTNYATALGASNFQFGVLAALPFVASFLTLPGTLLIEATGKRKVIFLICLLFQRLMWIPIALVPLWIYKTHGDAGRAWAANAFLGLIFLMQCGQAFGGMGWIGWMSDLIPPGIRGTYFSRRRQWGLLSSIPAALGAGWLLDHYALTNNAEILLTWCAVVFLVACVFGTLDIVVFFWVPDVPTAPKKGDHLMRSWGEPLRNRNFLWFAGFVAAYVFAVAPMGPFATKFIMTQLGAGDVTGGQSKGLNQITQLMLIVAPSAAQLLVFGVWGKAADRMGKRPVLILASLGMVPVAIGWCFITRDTIWLGYVVSGARWRTLGRRRRRQLQHRPGVLGIGRQERYEGRNGLCRGQCRDREHRWHARRVRLWAAGGMDQRSELDCAADRPVHLLPCAVSRQRGAAATGGSGLPAVHARTRSPPEHGGSPLHDLEHL